MKFPKITNARIAFMCFNLGFLGITIHSIFAINLFSDNGILEDAELLVSYYKYLFRWLVLVGILALIFAIRSKMTEDFSDNQKMLSKQEQAFWLSILWNVVMFSLSYDLFSKGLI